MSAELLFTDAARWQLRSAIETLRRSGAPVARAFVADVAARLRNPTALGREARPLAEWPDLPFREIRIDGYRFFVVEKDGTRWIAGVWNVNRTEPS